MIKTLLAILAGTSCALSFAPFNWWPLGMFGCAVLFCIWLSSGAKGAIWYGFSFGLALFGIGISWMYISLHTFGGMPPLIAGLCIFALVAFMSCYIALCGWLQSLFSKINPTIRLALVMPALWILIEWLRGWLFTGLPWLPSGYVLLDTPLSNFAPLGGVYLVGLVALVSAGTLAAIVRHTTLSNSVLALLISGFWVVGWQLNETSWTRAEGEPISVAIIQNNVPMVQKWDEAENNKIVADYMQRSQQHQDVDLIVWPEAAIPDYIDNISNTLWWEIENHPADFLFGVLHRDTVAGKTRYYNSVAAVSDKIMIYRKKHLVPFGEYFPFQRLLGPLIRMLNIPMSDFSAWEKPQKPLHAAGQKIALSICFEDAFPWEWRDQVVSAGVLANVSEDIWFGDSFAPHQRLQMARFRSRETERPMIRSSNNGLSSLINWKGGIDIYAPQFVSDVVKGQVQPRMGITPYSTFGEKPVLSVIGLLLLISVLFGRISRDKIRP